MAALAGRRWLGDYALLLENEAAGSIGLGGHLRLPLAHGQLACAASWR